MYSEAQTESHKVEKQTNKCTAPPEGSAKINVDARFRAETRDASVGVIISDCRGLILLDACKMLHRCSSVAQAEALACLEGIRLAIEWVHLPAILESDNVEVVASLTMKSSSISVWEGIIFEVKSNKITHALAQLAFSSRIYLEWRLCAPIEILELPKTGRWLRQDLDLVELVDFIAFPRTQPMPITLSELGQAGAEGSSALTLWLLVDPPCQS